MVISKTASIYGLLIVAVLQQVAEGRPLTTLSLDEMMNGSDLVAVCSAKSSVDVCTDHTFGSGKTYLTQIVTTLHVKMVLKGKHQESEVKVVHFRLSNNGVRPPNNGPLLVSFESKGEVIGKSLLSGAPVRSSNVPEYMIFLRQRKDGMYEPITGQEDARLSVRVLTVPQ